MVRFYVGNIKFEATQEDLRDFFDSYAVADVKLMLDRDTGKPRGFGFVEIDGVTAEQIVSEFDGREFMGRKLTVNEARPMEKRGGGKRRDDRRDRRDRDW